MFSKKFIDKIGAINIWLLEISASCLFNFILWNEETTVVLHIERPYSAIWIINYD